MTLQARDQDVEARGGGRSAFGLSSRDDGSVRWWSGQSGDGEREAAFETWQHEYYTASGSLQVCSSALGLRYGGDSDEGGGEQEGELVRRTPEPPACGRSTHRTAYRQLNDRTDWCAGQGERQRS